jgi:hypothetical protein
VNILQLQPGDTVRVVKTFRDFDRREVNAGTTLTFERSEFLPYHGGYTFYFQGGFVVRLCENEPQDELILGAPAGAFFERAAR